MSVSGVSKKVKKNKVDRCLRSGNHKIRKAESERKMDREIERGEM